MPCNGGCGNLENQEVFVCNTVFKYRLVPIDNFTNAVCVSRCNTPTATYDVATVRTRTNACSEGTFYQATVNGDPVEIIQDCSLCEIIKRSIEIYFQNFEPINCPGRRNNGCNNIFGF